MEHDGGDADRKKLLIEFYYFSQLFDDDSFRASSRVCLLSFVGFCSDFVVVENIKFFVHRH